MQFRLLTELFSFFPTRRELLQLTIVSDDPSGRSRTSLQAFGFPNNSELRTQTLLSPVHTTSVSCPVNTRRLWTGLRRFSPSRQDNTMATVTAPPTLPASWRPTESACVSSSDYWHWDYGSASDNWVVLGGPSQTTECLPTSWASEVVYSGVQCPQKYTSACQGTDSHSEVTCCPKYVRLSKQLLRHRRPRRC